MGFIRGQGGRAGGHGARVRVLHLIARNRPLDAGDGELEGLVAAGEGGLRVRGIVGIFVKALDSGVERHRVGEPIGVGGLAAVGRLFAVRQLPRVGAAVGRLEVSGLARDADVRPHGVGHGTAADTGRDGGGDGLKRRIELAAVRGVIGILGVRGRGSGDAVTQEVADQRPIRIVSFDRIPPPILFMRTARCPAAVIGRAKADRVQAGRFLQRGRTLCCRHIGVGAAIAAVLTGIAAIICRNTIRQGDDISAVLGDTAHRGFLKLACRGAKTRIQIRAAIRGQSVDRLHRGVVASRGGDILPVLSDARTPGKAHKRDIAANARGIALVAVQELNGRRLCRRKTGIRRRNRSSVSRFAAARMLILPAPIGIAAVTGRADIHRPGRVEHQHGRGRTGRCGRGGLGGLDLQINPIGVRLPLDGGRLLAQRDGIAVTGVIRDRAGAAVLRPFGAAAILAVNHVAALVFSENGRGKQAQRQTHGHDERKNSFFHVYVLSFQILCALRPPRRRRKRALALLRCKKIPGAEPPTAEQAAVPFQAAAQGHQHSPAAKFILP